MIDLNDKPMETPKVGERWKISIEGTVTDDAGTFVYVDCGLEDQLLISIDEGSWERLPDPEPEYIAGEIYRDSVDKDWLRTALSASHPWMLVGGGHAVYLESTPKRPLTRLVKESK